MNSPTLPSIEPLFTDHEVARMLDPGGTRIRARSIRSEREAGRLVGTKIAGKWLYRGSDVAAFLSAAREVKPPCPAPMPAPGSSSSATSARPDHQMDRSRPETRKVDGLRCLRSWGSSRILRSLAQRAQTRRANRPR